VNKDLNRSLVSFQANKKLPIYRWFKYKEGFSEDLVRYLLENLTNEPGTILDPFAGTGATLFASKDLGWESTGIEILPVGIYFIKIREIAEKINPILFEKQVKHYKSINLLDYEVKKSHLNHLPITKGAFPNKTERDINSFLNYCNIEIEDEEIKSLFLFSCFSILEIISYTRKDGQYLRWDCRSNRSNSNFNKGKIYDFSQAINSQLDLMINDLKKRNIKQVLIDREIQSKNSNEKKITILKGSCLELLPKIEDNTFDFLLTSPPYCNRYDYTRTYALELMFLNKSPDDVKRLRQEMLSCTVENKSKLKHLENYYNSVDHQDIFQKSLSAFNNQEALHECLEILEQYRKDGKLNNPNIVRMIRNYFLEMSIVIFEMHRLMKKNGIVAMVNDNVQYAGEAIPVDLILSDFAKSAGFSINKIWTLERGKGNSSQQMGNNGRTELRKCVYIWTK
jgi:DNA modification methylase